MGRERISMPTAAREAVSILGQLVRLARQDRGWTLEELGARTGVSARTVRLIEHGDANVSLGNVFNVATTVGVPLFGTDDVRELSRMRIQGQERIALLPARVRERKLPEVNLDF